MRRTAAGNRVRTCASVNEDLREEKFDGWPVVGPRCLSWCADFLMREGRTLQLHYERFWTLAKVELTSWGIAEHAELCYMLEAMALYDQADVSNLASAEMMFRRLQVIEYSYLEKVRPNESQVAGGRLSAEEQGTTLPWFCVRHCWTV